MRKDSPDEYDAHDRSSHSRPQDLEREIGDEAKRLADYSGERWLSVLGVAVRDRDGMTWGAERCANAIAAKLGPSWYLRFVQGAREGRPDSVQELSALFGGDAVVIDAAKESGLVPEVRIPWRWIVPLAVLSVALIFAELFLAQKNAAALVGLPVVVVLALLALAKFSGKLVGELVKVTFAPQTKVKILAALRQPAVDKEAEQRLRNALIARLGEVKRRAVVIDGLDRLHERTLKVVLGYAASKGEWSGGVELWVIFERYRTGALTERLALPPDSTANVVRRYQQSVRDREGKRALLEKVLGGDVRRDDPRLSQVVVADVRDDRRADAEAALEEVRAKLEGADRPVRRAFALLALDSAVSDPLRLGVGEFEALAQAAQRAQPPPAAMALASWFGDKTSGPTTVRAAFDAVAEDFAELLEDEPQGGDSNPLVVDKVYADVFRAARLRKHGIRSHNLGHTFWALYCLERLEERAGAHTADRLSAHVRAVREPPEGDLAGALYDAATRAAAASLSFSLPNASALVERANRALARPFNATNRERAEQLLRLAWAVHALTGERAVLSSATSLAGALDASAEELADPLVALFLETRIPPDGVSLTLGALTSDRAVLDHASARAAFFAVIAEPLLERRFELGAALLKGR